MTTRIWLLAIGLLAFVVFVVIHSVRPYDWHSQLATPPGVPAQNIVVTCGALWGSASPEVPPTTAYPIGGQPCADHAQLRAMSIIDVLLGVAGLGVIAVWATRRSDRGDLAQV